MQSPGLHPGPRAFGNSLRAHHGGRDGAHGAQPPPLTVTREAPPSSLTPIISSWPFPCPVAVSPSVPLHEGLACWTATRAWEVGGVGGSCVPRRQERHQVFTPSTPTRGTGDPPATPGHCCTPNLAELGCLRAPCTPAGTGSWSQCRPHPAAASVKQLSCHQRTARWSPRVTVNAALGPASGHPEDALTGEGGRRLCVCVRACMCACTPAGAEGTDRATQKPPTPGPSRGHTEGLLWSAAGQASPETQPATLDAPRGPLGRRLPLPRPRCCRSLHKRRRCHGG